MTWPVNKSLLTVPLSNGLLKRIKDVTLPDELSIRLRYVVDLCALGWIGWFAWQYAGFLLRDDLYLYGDHPGQFYRLWQLVNIVWSEEGRLISWMPHWHAGRPELQFYPPGAALTGWLLWMISFQQLSLFIIYQSLVFASYILPAIGLYLLLAWGLGDRLAGMAAAWLVMTFPFPLGGVQGVIIGILGYHLAFGLIPFLILSGLWLMRARRKTWPWLVTGFILAATLLLHPFQFLLPLGVLTLYIFLCKDDRQRRLRWLVWVVLLALGLTAFWWLPLATQYQFFIPVIEGPLQDIRTHFENMWSAEMDWLLACAFIGGLFRQGHRRALSLALLLAGLALFGFIFFNALVLVGQFQLYFLDSVRLIAGVTCILLTGAALGLAELAWAGIRLLRRRRWDMLGLPLLIIAPLFFYNQFNEKYDFTKWMSKWQPAHDRTPLFLNEAEAKYRFSEVWQAMAQTPGRVLYTSSYALLFDVPTSLKTLTPYLAGREMVGGAFTIRSPVASYLWSGQLAPPVLHGKAEAEDDKRFASVPWEAMTDAFLSNLARHFNVTLIATTPTDIKARAFLDGSSQFKSTWSNPLFTLYEVSGYEPTWAEAERATATVTRYDRTAIDVEITDAAPDATLLVKVAYFPRWRAEVNGQPLPIQMSDYGLISIKLPPGSYTVNVRYGPAWPERLGGMISLMTALLALGSLVGGSIRALGNDD